MISFFANINAQTENEIDIVKNQDTIYIYRGKELNRTSVNYIALNENSNSILVQITYVIRPESYWEALKKAKEKGELIGNTYHSNFVLNYIMGCTTSDETFLKEYPKGFKLISKEDKKKLDIIDWDLINDDDERIFVLKKIANADVIYVVEKINKTQFLLREVKISSL